MFKNDKILIFLTGLRSDIVTLMYKFVESIFAMRTTKSGQAKARNNQPEGMGSPLIVHILEAHPVGQHQRSEWSMMGDELYSFDVVSVAGDDRW